MMGSLLQVQLFQLKMCVEVFCRGQFLCWSSLSSQIYHMCLWYSSQQQSKVLPANPTIWVVCGSACFSFIVIISVVLFKIVPMSCQYAWLLNALFLVGIDGCCRRDCVPSILLLAACDVCAPSLSSISWCVDMWSCSHTMTLRLWLPFQSQACLRGHSV